MRYLLPVVIYFTVLSGCTTTGTGLRPGASSNEAAVANLNLAIEYMRIGNLETALERLNRAHDADPKYFATHNVYGLLYQRLGEPDRAERHFKRAISLNNNDSASKNNYGNFLCQAGRYKEAEEIFLSAAVNPLYDTPEVAYSNAATCAMMNNRQDTAEKYFRNALSLNPSLPAALIQMSELSYKQNNYLSARGYLQRYLAIARHTPRTLSLGIKIEEELGDTNTVSSYRMLLKNNFPDSPEAQELMKSTVNR